LTTGFGSALRQGNCATTYRGELFGYYDVRCAFGRSTSKDASVADGQFRQQAVDFIRAHKSRFPVVAAARVGRTFGVYRPFQQMHLDTNRNTKLWIVRLGFAMYWVLVPFAVAGGVLAHRRRIALSPLLAFPATVVMTTLLTIGQTRYRASAEIAIVLLGAYGISGLIGRWRARAPSMPRPARAHVADRDVGELPVHGRSG
jgi:hypothetical protein